MHAKEQLLCLTMWYKDSQHEKSSHPIIIHIIVTQCFFYNSSVGHINIYIEAMVGLLVKLAFMES